MMSDTSVSGERSGLHAGPVRLCPTCGTEAPGDANFCGNCGAALPEGAERRGGAEPDGPPGGERDFKRISVIFCDMVRSVETAEVLEPEVNDWLMESYLAVIRDVSGRHGGAVGAIVGDGVLIVFGVPTWYEDHALRAVQAAHELRGALADAGRRLAGRHAVTVKVRMGIHTGEVPVGPTAAPAGVGRA